jgi:hypothetical protein
VLCEFSCVHTGNQHQGAAWSRTSG